MTQENPTPPVSGDALYPAKQLGVQPLVHPTARVLQSTLGAWTDIGPNCVVLEATIGDYTYLAGDALVKYADLGKFCSLASHACVHPVNHPMQRVTQHHFTYRRRQYGFGEQDDLDFFAQRRDDRVVIGHDVWIGHGATITAGVHIATGAVIGAGAVVTHDVGPYEVVGGVPAHIIRKRFPDAVIEKLLAIAWWDWDRATLEARFDDLLDLNQFLEKYG